MVFFFCLFEISLIFFILQRARKKIFENLSESLNLDKSVNFSVYAERSKNYTGADIQSILTSANMIAVKECIEKDTEVSVFIFFFYLNFQ